MKRGVAALGLVLGFAAAAVAQDNPEIRGYSFLGEDRWGKLKNPDMGKKYYVEGRWLEFYRPGISFYKRNDMRKFLIVPGKAGDPLYDNVVGNKDSLGNALIKRRSMVRVFGQPFRMAGRIVLKVDRVDRTDDEDKQFLTRLEAAGDDLDKLMKLGRECAARAKLMEDKALEAVAKQITEQELRSRFAKIKANDFRGMLDLGKRYETELDDPSGAIRIFGRVAESRDAPRALKVEAMRYLRARKAVRVRTPTDDGKVVSRWLTFAEFKHIEGFVFRSAKKGPRTEAWEHKERWVTREWAELEAARKFELQSRVGKVIAVRTNPHQHRLAAEAGRIERGQNFVEVAHAFGTPKLVNHWAGKLEGKDVMWSQWVLKDGQRVYFVAGEVISNKSASEDWPGSEWEG